MKKEETATPEPTEEPTPEPTPAPTAVPAETQAANTATVSPEPITEPTPAPEASEKFTTESVLINFRENQPIFGNSLLSDVILQVKTTKAIDRVTIVSVDSGRKWIAEKRTDAFSGTEYPVFWFVRRTELPAPGEYVVMYEINKFTVTEKFIWQEK